MNVVSILCDTLRSDHCGPYLHGRPLSEVTGDGQPDWVVPTDPNELNNLADRKPEQLARMQAALSNVLETLGAPNEQYKRLGLAKVTTV